MNTLLLAGLALLAVLVFGALTIYRKFTALKETQQKLKQQVEQLQSDLNHGVLVTEPRPGQLPPPQMGYYPQQGHGVPQAGGQGQIPQAGGQGHIPQPQQVPQVQPQPQAAPQKPPQQPAQPLTVPQETPLYMSPEVAAATQPPNQEAPCSFLDNLLGSFGRKAVSIPIRDEGDYYPGDDDGIRVTPGSPDDSQMENPVGTMVSTVETMLSVLAPSPEDFNGDSQGIEISPDSVESIPDGQFIKGETPPQHPNENEQPATPLPQSESSGNISGIAHAALDLARRAANESSTPEPVTTPASSASAKNVSVLKDSAKQPRPRIAVRKRSDK